MRSYPEIRAAKPRKWFWLVNIIPVVQSWPDAWRIGMYQHPGRGFDPILRRPYIAIRRRKHKYTSRIKVNG